MNGRTAARISCIFLALLWLIPAVLAAQTPGTDIQSQNADASANAAAQSVLQNPQALSQTGLLPVFAVDMNFSPSWVDGNDAPSQSPKYSHNGVSDEFQAAWDALRPAGFNAIRFALDLRDEHSPARLANLCLWAKANSVLLIPLLENTATNNAAASLPSAVASRLRGGDGQQLPAYTQIAYFQVENSMNIGSLHPKSSTPDVLKALLASADALRSSEVQALQGTGVQATPIMVSVSFDYELIQQGAAAAVPLDPSIEQKAQSTLKDFLAPVASAANVDAVNVVWLPGSLSSGDEGHLAGLLRELQSALPNKQLVLTTGFSGAFHTADQASQFFTVSMTNLWDFRLSSGGASSPFQGVIFQRAFQGAKADVPPPSGTGDPSQWNWNEKAQGLARMWAQGKSTDDLKWWMNKVEANEGLLATQSGASGGPSYVASPGLQVLQQISTTFAQASQNITPPASGSANQSVSDPATAASGTAATAAPGSTATTDPSALASTTTFATGTTAAATLATPGAQGAATASDSSYSQLLSSLVQQVTAQITNAMATRLAGRAAGGPQSFAYSPGTGGANAFATPNAGASYQSGATSGSQNGGTNSPAWQSGSTSGSSASGPTTTTASASAVSLGPQDVTLDNANVAPGQTVHITARIHNASADQDVSGLTIQLVDPANPGASQQSVQSGISVLRSSMTPVQLSWVAGQPGNTPPPLSVVILDSSGAQVASAPLPAITIASATGGSSTSNSTTGNSATSTGDTQAGGAGSTGGGQTSSGQSGQTSANGSVSVQAVAPQISYFGPANAGASSAFSVQVVNPSPTPMASVQAQLYLDGKPGPIVQLGAMLPRQARSIGFDPAVAGTAKQSVKVVVSSGGASVSATAPPAPKGSNIAPRPGLGPAINLNPAAGPVAAVRVPVRSAFATANPVARISTPSIASPAPSATPKVIGNAPAPVRLLGGPPSPSTQTGAVPPSPRSTPVTRSGALPATGAPSAPTTRAIPPPGIPGATQTTRAIQPLGTTPPNQTPAPAQASTTPFAAPATRTAPPWVQPTPNQAARAVQPSGTGLAVQTLGAAQTATPFPAQATPKAPLPWAAPANRALPGGGASGHLDLSVVSGDIHVNAGAQPGQIAITALVRNLSALSASGATVTFRLLSGGRPLAASPPISFSIPGSGAYQATWTTSAPAGQALQLVVAVSASGDVNQANNQASLSFTAPRPAQVRH